MGDFPKIGPPALTHSENSLRVKSGNAAGESPLGQLNTKYLKMDLTSPQHCASSCYCIRTACLEAVRVDFKVHNESLLMTSFPMFEDPKRLYRGLRDLSFQRIKYAYSHWCLW